MTNIRDYTEQNRRAWNEIAVVRERTWPGADFFAQGGSLLGEAVVAAGGAVHDLTLLHLQCATGEDTLSWSNLGAVATGVDISDARSRSHGSGGRGSTRFVAVDIYALPAELQRGDFDLVYTGGGALVWVPDIVRWAEIVAAALRPGGRLLLAEEHPVAGCLWVTDGKLEVTDDYFGRGKATPDQGWAHFAGGERAQETKYQFAWPLGDIITALANAGLRIESLQEFPSDAAWRFGGLLDTVQRLPGSYLLIARRPA